MLNVSQTLKVIHHVDKYLHNRIIYLNGEAWTHTTSFHHPILLKYMYKAGNVSAHVMCVGFVSVFTIFQLDFGTVPSMWYLELFHQCGIWNCSINVVFGTVPSMWYLCSCYVEMTYVNICRNLSKFPKCY